MEGQGRRAVGIGVKLAGLQSLPQGLNIDGRAYASVLVYTRMHVFTGVGMCTDTHTSTTALPGETWLILEVRKKFSFTS